MSDVDGLRDRIADVIERSLAAWVNDIAPGSDHAAPDYAAQAIIDEFGLIVVDVPGGISDYSPFTGKPVVQPDRWYVEGERVLEREPRP